MKIAQWILQSVEIFFSLSFNLKFHLFEAMRRYNGYANHIGHIDALLSILYCMLYGLYSFRYEYKIDTVNEAIVIVFYSTIIIIIINSKKKRRVEC